MIILLNGAPCVGKDLIAKYLCRHHQAKHLSFVAPLKFGLAQMLGMPNVSPLIGRETKEDYRQLMIDVSEKCIKPFCGQNHWAYLTLKHIKRQYKQGHRLFVISDLGFQDEADYIADQCSWCLDLHKMPVQIWHINRPGFDFSRDSRSLVTHPKATLHVLENTGTLDDLYSLVERTIRGQSSPASRPDED